MGLPRCVDRPHARIARPDTAQWSSRSVLEYIGQQSREDAGTRLSVIGGPSEQLLEAARRYVQRAEPQLSRLFQSLSRPHGPLEITGKIGNYIKLNIGFSLFSHVARA